MSAVSFPWWAWAVVAGVIVLSVVDRKQRAGRRASHRKYLRGRDWKEKRKLAMTRAAGRCQDCGRTGSLHAHHLTYKRHGNEHPDDLRVLCASCHRRRHRDGGRIDDLIDRLVAWIRRGRR